MLVDPKVPFSNSFSSYEKFNKPCSHPRLAFFLRIIPVSTIAAASLTFVSDKSGCLDSAVRNIRAYCALHARTCSFFLFRRTAYCHRLRLSKNETLPCQPTPSVAATTISVG